MKKLIAIAIVVVMLLSMMPMMASAETEYYVTGTLDAAWDWNAAAQKMEKEGDVYTYTAPYVHPSSTAYECKVTDGTWSNSWPGSNVTINVTAISSVKVTFNPDTKEVSTEVTPLDNPSTEGIIVHVNAAVWGSSAPNLWAWGANGNLYNNWPGEAMSADKYNTGWYTISLDYTFYGLLVNNGSAQTVNTSVYAGQEVWLTVGEKSGDKHTLAKSTTAPDGWVNADDTYKVTLHLNYEGCPDASSQTTTDGKITLPADPTRTGYTFNGWYDAATGGNKVTNDTVYTADSEIYAQWTETQPSGGDTVDYYLVGFINGADYGCEADYQNMGDYKFVNGKLTAKFTADSYVFIKTSNNAKWYLAESYCTDTTVTLAEGKSEKLFVPAGEVTFTLVVNTDGTLTLSYTTTTTSGGNQDGTQSGNQGGSQDATAGNPQPPTGGDSSAEVTEITVYVKVPENWDGPCLWAWNRNGSTDTNVFEKWPGGALTLGSNGWYSIKVPVDTNYLIVNAHNGEWQTPDTAIEQTGKDIWVEVVVDEAGQASVVMQYTSPATGDSTIIAPVVILMVLSVAGLAVLVVGKKKFF